MCKPSLICLKFSSLKFFSKFLFLILEEHSRLFPPTCGNTSISTSTSLPQGKAPLFQKSLIAVISPPVAQRFSVLQAPPTRALVLPSILISVSTGPTGCECNSRPSLLSLFSFASFPTGKLGPSACSPFDSINSSTSTSALTSQMPECQLLSVFIQLQIHF